MATENEYKNNRLEELGGSDFEIADGQPNIKGWDVKDENGQKIGEVDELLFDKQSLKVRYLIVDLEGNVFDLDTRDVLVPIGIAQLHEKDDDVILPGVTAEHLRSLPDYDKDQLDGDFESKVRNTFAGAGLTGAAVAGSHLPGSDDFYSHDHFNEDNLYRNRNRGTDEASRNYSDDASDRVTNTDEDTTIPVIREDLEVGKEEVERGGMRLRSRIVEIEASKDINLREEKVTVERTPVDRPASSNDIREESVEMIAKEEVPVVNKEARVVEEVTLNKEVNEREETVRDTVRNTEVDVEKTDGDKTNRDYNKGL
jgi:uncharacterized protein (TIGR02271 family)